MQNWKRKLGYAAVFGISFSLIGLGSCGSPAKQTAPAKTESAKMSGTTYKSTLYIAGMGGHVASAKVLIDPSLDQPIQMQKLSRIKIGLGKEGPTQAKITHPVHDPRIDNKDRNVMFWATYKIDPNTNSMHVGKHDLTSKKEIMSIDAPMDEKVTQTGSIYCASAQTAEYYMPIAMTHPGYIDIYNKSDLSLVRKVFLEGTEATIGAPYKFYHGTNSNDMSKLLLTINETESDHGKFVGKLHIFLLDMNEFVKGNVKVLKKTVIDGPEKGYIGFRMYFSPDDKVISIAAANQLLFLNAETLELNNRQDMPPGTQAHDAIFTPDGKFVIATSRTKMDDTIRPLDGEVMLYDVANKHFVGKATSTCLTCHKDEDIEGKATLCGIDANWDI